METWTKCLNWLNYLYFYFIYGEMHIYTFNIKHSKISKLTVKSLNLSYKSSDALTYAMQCLCLLLFEICHAATLHASHIIFVYICICIWLICAYRPETRVTSTNIFYGKNENSCSIFALCALIFYIFSYMGYRYSITIPILIWPYRINGYVHCLHSAH